MIEVIESKRRSSGQSLHMNKIFSLRLDESCIMLTRQSAKNLL